MGKLVVSRHALERYRDRVRPALGLEAVRAELARILPQGKIVMDCPSWLTEAEHKADAYLELTEQIVFPLRRRTSGGFGALTCLTHRTISPERRASRNKRKAAQRAKRSIHRDKQRERRHAKKNRQHDAA